MDSDESSQKPESQLIQQPASQQLQQQVPENFKKKTSNLRKIKRTIGCHKKRKKAKKAVASSDVLVPLVPKHLAPLAAAHPQQVVPLAFPPNPVPTVVLEQPPNPPHQAAAEHAAHNNSLDDPTTVEYVHWSLITTSMRR
jgi:hypothetical protein